MSSGPPVLPARSGCGRCGVGNRPGGVRVSCGGPCEWLAVVTEVSPAWDLRPMDSCPASHRFTSIARPGRVRQPVLAKDPERPSTVDSGRARKG